MKIFASILTYMTLLLTGTVYADDLSLKVVNLNPVSDYGVQKITFKDKEGRCQYFGETAIGKQKSSVMRLFSTTEKVMLISISSKRCNDKITSVKLYALPDQERLNKSISVFDTSSKVMIPQGSEFFLTKKKTELSWYVKS